MVRATAHVKRGTAKTQSLDKKGIMKRTHLQQPNEITLGRLTGD